MARTNITYGKSRVPKSVKTKLDEHDTALDALEALTGGTTDYKASVRCATTANHGLSGLTAIDGVTPVAGDRVLAKSQSAGAENGIYVAASGAWARATDADASAEVTAGLQVYVSEGTVNGDQIFDLTTDDAPIVLGTTALVFTKRPTLAELASTANAKGASLVGIEDAAGKITATNVETALAEIAADNWVAGAHIAANAITGPKLSETALKTFVVAAGNGAGARTATGAKIGDKVFTCVNLTDLADQTASFETTISVADQIQQTGTDLTNDKVLVQVVVKS